MFEQGFVRKSGAWYTYEGDQLGREENARGFLRDNPDLADEIEKKIKEKLGIGPRLDAPVDAVPADFMSGPVTSSGRPGAEDAHRTTRPKPGRSHPAPAGSGAPFPDVVDFDLLAAPAPQQASQVVDFDALVATSPDADADAGLVEHLSTPGKLQRTVLPATAAEVSVLAGRGRSCRRGGRRHRLGEPPLGHRRAPTGTAIPAGTARRTSPPTAGQLGSEDRTTAATAVTAAVAPARPRRERRGRTTTTATTTAVPRAWASGVEAVDVRRRGVPVVRWPLPGVGRGQPPSAHGVGHPARRGGRCR